MNKEIDRSLVSAYLDGELDKVQTESLEAMLEADRGLAEELIRVRSGRDLVAKLSRPSSPRDLSNVLVSKLALQSKPASGSSFRERWLLPVSAAAAAIALASSLTFAYFQQGLRNEHSWPWKPLN